MRTIFRSLFQKPFLGILMIISDFNPFRPLVYPNETYPELLIDPHAVLPLAISLETFQIVPRGYSQGTERNDSVQLIQFSPGDLPKAFRTGSPRFLRVYSVKNVFSSLVVKGADHPLASETDILFLLNIMDIVIRVNSDAVGPSHPSI
jgi:hypothetical protein